MFYLSWRGVGWLAIVLPLIMMAIATFISGPFTAAIRNSVLIGAIAVAVVGLWLNRGERSSDGKQRHLLWGIPMQWYGAVWLLLFFFGWNK